MTAPNKSLPELPATKVWVKCRQCKDMFIAKKADRKRGWGIYCSKSCKAIRQEGKTGQYARYLSSKGAFDQFGFRNPESFSGGGDVGQ